MDKKDFEKLDKIKNGLFYLVLGILSVIGLLWFCRPTESAIEKRELTSFPEFTLAGLLDGSFTKGVDIWYADTYPLRELLIAGNYKMRSFYGDQSTQLISKNEHADDIPDLDSATPPSPDNTPDDDQTDAVLPPQDGNPDNETPDTSPENNPPDDGQDDTPEDDTSEEEPLPDGTITTPGEMNGSIYVTGNSAYGLYYFVKSAVDSYAAMINHTYEVLGDEADVYSLVAPIGSGVMLDPALLEAFGASDQRNAIEYMNSMMDEGVHALNVFDNIKKHNAEYVYFRTDHHWTALGAYYAYEEFAREKGVTPHTLDQFEQREYPDFLGTFYSSTQSAALAETPDTVTAYVPMGTNSMTMTTRDGQELNWYIIASVAKAGRGEKYLCFSGGDEPYSVAHNPQITDGSACVVIKDSFGNAFIPFLVDHYEYVYWIDYRYYDGTLTDLVKEKDIDDIIYCLNIYNPTEASMVKRMSELVP